MTPKKPPPHAWVIWSPTAGFRLSLYESKADANADLSQIKETYANFTGKCNWRVRRVGFAQPAPTRERRKN